MNDQERPAEGPETELPELPELSDERIDAIEATLFERIGQDRTRSRSKRTTLWAAGGAAAAVIVVAAVIAPSVGTLITGASTNDAAVAPADPLVDSAEVRSADGGAVDPGTTEGMAPAEIAGQSGAGDVVTGDTARDIITTASATVVVEDITAAAEIVADAAQSRDGYVESMSIGTSGQVMPVDPMTGMVYDTTMPYPVTPDGAWITVRVPADGLQSLIDQLSGLGEVTASSINRQDVTAATLDLQARVDAAQASVDRLTELMAQAGSLTDLIAAEAALAERQATLESYLQQLKYYDDQVAMSTLTVTLTEPVETVTADPAGFGDGLAAGWNGVVATLNGIVIALGFLLPWILVVGVIGLIAWGVVAVVRRSRRTRRAVDADTATDPRGSDPTN
jgi:hypothetical protein